MLNCFNSKDWRSKNLFGKRNSSPVATVYPFIQEAELSHSVQYGCSSAPVCGETTALVEVSGSQEGLQGSAETSGAGTGSSEGVASQEFRNRAALISFREA